MAWGKETIAILELDQPRCANEYGDAYFTPAGVCTAKIGVTGSRKCARTGGTCQDTENLDLSETQTLRFSKPQVGLLQHGYVIPSIVSIDTTPGRINLAGMDASASALGQREVITVRLEDHQHSDHLTDPYRLERSFAAAIRWPGRFTGSMFRGRRRPQRIARRAFFGGYDASADPYKRGRFWPKFIARNPHHAGFACRLLEGELGQALADMRVRHYVLDRIDGPNDGQVVLIAKDAFTLIEDRKAVAPRPSSGELLAGLTSGGGSSTLSPAGIGNAEYPAAGYAAIGDELLGYTRVGDAMTWTQRGAFGTTAAAHDVDDIVQVVLEFVSKSPHDIVHTLFTEYGGIPGAMISLPVWEARAASITDLYTARIAKPTPVAELAGELEEQAGFTVWPDVTTGLIDFVPLRAGAVSPVVTDRAWIIDGTLTTRRLEEKRLAQVEVYYGLRNPLGDLKEPRNYHSRLIGLRENLFSTSPRKEIFSRWIPQFGRQNARRTADRIGAMFAMPPLNARFDIDASRDGQLQLARYFALQTADVQDETGAEKQVAMTPIALERSETRTGVEAHGLAFTVDDETGLLEVFIENDDFNLNLRSIFDTIFPAPDGTEQIVFHILPGVRIGSTSTAVPAIRTGVWPAMAIAPLIVFDDPGVSAKGRVQGKGGAAGAGGSAYDGGGFMVTENGGNGENGGDALLVESPFQIDDLFGEIFGGGAGSGGGGAAVQEVFPFLFPYGGAAGGAGAGTNPGAGAVGGTPDGTGSSAATADAGSAAGSPSGFAGAAFAGGGPGVSGSNGNPGTGNFQNGGGGLAGTRGKYVNGNSLVTWVNHGDERGAVA